MQNWGRGGQIVGTIQIHSNKLYQNFGLGPNLGLRAKLFIFQVGIIGGGNCSLQGGGAFFEGRWFDERGVFWKSNEEFLQMHLSKLANVGDL